jgi:hypothetical protein
MRVFFLGKVGILALLVGLPSCSHIIVMAELFLLAQPGILNLDPLLPFETDLRLGAAEADFPVEVEGVPEDISYPI